MSRPNTTAEQWAASVAALAVDALLDAGLVSREQFEAARVIVAEEVFVRLCCNDYPPAVDYDRIGSGQPLDDMAAHRHTKQAEPPAGADGGLASSQ